MTSGATIIKIFLRTDWPNFVHVGVSFWFSNFTSVEFKFKPTFIGVCCCNAATKHSMVWIVMPTFYCNYFLAWNSGAPYTRGPPGLCQPCMPTPLLRHCRRLRTSSMHAVITGRRRCQSWNTDVRLICRGETLHTGHADISTLPWTF